MNILYIAMCAPYSTVSHAGGQTLNYYINKMANDKTVVVDLMTYCTEEIVSKLYDDLKNINVHLIIRHYNLKNIVRDILSLNSKINPFYKYCNLMTWNASDLLLRSLEKLRNKGYKPDTIIMEWTQITLQIDEIMRIFPDAKYVASEHDVTFLAMQRKAEYEKNPIKKLYKNLQAQNTCKREINALHKCDLVITHNEKDKQLLTMYGLNEKTIFSLVPYFHQSQIEYHRTNNDILFFGYMRRNENVIAAKWFIDNVMPLISDLPCRFIVIGGGINEDIKSWANNRVIITGYVPTIDDYFAHAMCFVSPLLLGAGIKVKVLEALYTGIPVLTNSIGIEGIPAEKDIDYYHCELAEDYERIIRKLFHYKLNQIYASGKKFMEKQFSLDNSFEQYSMILKNN